MADREYLLNTIKDFKYQIEKGNTINSLVLLDFLNEAENKITELEKTLAETKERMEFRTAQVFQQYGIIDALSVDCVAIYVVACDNLTIVPVKQPDNYNEKIDGSWNYDEAVSKYAQTRVHPDDQEDFINASNFNSIRDILSRTPIFYHHFRIIVDGKIHYYYLKGTKVESAGVLNAVMLGFVCEDETKEKEILKSLSETDSMTKLYNHGTGEAKIRNLLKEGKNGLFCMLDVDKFKSINDTFGHSAGDDVIIQVAHELKNAFKDDDIVLRLGGDEFAAYAPGVMNRQVGMNLLRSFLRRVQELDIPSIQGRKIEISMGAVLTYGENIQFEDIYEKADRGVYISKKTVGNSITFYPDEESILIE